MSDAMVGSLCTLGVNLIWSFVIVYFIKEARFAWFDFLDSTDDFMKGMANGNDTNNPNNDDGN